MVIVLLYIDIIHIIVAIMSNKLIEIESIDTNNNNKRLLKYNLKIN